jgi:hypothetical protein
VEHGLVPEVRVQGRAGDSIEERPRFHHIPGVSIAVIHDYRLPIDARRRDEHPRARQGRRDGVARDLARKQKSGTLPKEDSAFSCCSTRLRGPDLNQRPSGYEPDELPGCSTARHLLPLQVPGQGTRPPERRPGNEVQSTHGREMVNDNRHRSRPRVVLSVFQALAASLFSIAPRLCPPAHRASQSCLPSPTEQLRPARPETFDYART